MPLVDESPAATYFPNLPVHVKRMGRPFGTRNHLSKTCKENIQAVFDGLGGWESMLAWAGSHRSEFYLSVYPRLLANEGVVKGSGNIRVVVYGAPTDKPLDLHGTDTTTCSVEGQSDEVAHDATP